MIETEPACVMIVDDEPGIRETLAEMVEMLGCSAITAANGVEALELLASRRPCLMILDLIMPQLSGLELLEKIRTMPELSGLEVVISTSAPHLAPPGVPLLPKPIKLQAARDWISKACSCVPVNGA